MQSYDESLNALLENASAFRLKQRVGLDNALGRVLSDEIYAKSDYPSEPMAAMDGYACLSQDLENGAKLKIIDKIPAGKLPSVKISPKTCAKIFTGSLMPQGANTLIPIENVSASDEYIVVNEPVGAGFAVRGIGESYFRGEFLFKAGVRLKFSELAVLAELGEHFVNVLAMPKVAILATGSELVDLGAHKNNMAQIYSSNTIALDSIVKSCGCQSLIMPLVNDDKKELENAVHWALQTCDILLSSGGVSVGDFDFMRDFVRQNAKIIVDKAAIKPGRHIKIAKMNEKFIFALPGFSQSAMVTAMLYFRPFVAKIMGEDIKFWHKAILQNDYKKRSELEEFVAANLEFDQAKITLNTQNKKKASSAVSTNLNHNAVLFRAKKDLKAGEIVEFCYL